MSLWEEFVTSGIGVATANIITNPIDVVKVRLQLQNLNDVKQPFGMYKMGSHIVKTEGISSLYNGIGPSIVRGFVFGGARLGMYHPIKTMLYGDDKSFSGKLISGTLSGVFASAATNPIELIKTRLQSAKTDNNAFKVIKDILEKDGVYGLWKGSVPGMVRSSVLTASQCATYEEVKKTLAQNFNMTESLSLHFSSSMIAGFVTTTITNPIDVIKTNMYVQKTAYTGMIDCGADILKKDGLSGFMKGWAASYTRLGPQTVIMFIVTEEMRKLFGMSSM
jgi:solute carrier family 25 uncoupling protein 8/9